ncbi:MAG: protein phosphatase CheZ [Alphaproteobacteria bacterium]|nr:protein phosphatase CheZ [Alphaproteobacteria bacterium]
MRKDKVFSAEKKLNIDGDINALEHSDLVETIMLMREEIYRLSELLQHKTPRELSPEEEAIAIANEQESIAIARIEEQAKENEHLKVEIFTLSLAIQDTKVEIASLSTNEAPKKDIGSISEELDAIVASTEKATENILDCAEKIDDMANNIQTLENGSNSGKLAEEISAMTSTIFEACNFQDLTGQRITKALNVLSLVEKHIEKMIEIWGRDNIKEIIKNQISDESEKSQEEEGVELSGPANEDEGINQDDIDALFD